MKLFNSNEGEYIFGFFSIHINFNLEFMRNKLVISGENKPTYFHEYIHFLQNFTTTYCIRNTHFLLSQLIGSIYCVQNSETTNIKLPIRLEKIAFGELSNELINYSEGDYDDTTYIEYDDIKIIKIEKYKIEEDKTLFSKEDYEIIKKYIPMHIQIKVRNDTMINVINFNFGAWAIKESMASIIENNLFGNYHEKKIIQYDIAKLICNFILGYNLDERLIVELCEVSLMYDNPAKAFMSYLYASRKEKFKPNKFGDILKFFRTHTPTPKSYMSLYHRYKNSLIENISNLIINEKLYYFSNYINDLIRLAYRFRRNRNSSLLISKFLWGSSAQKNRYIKFMQKIFQPPILIDKRGKVYFPKIKNNNNLNSLVLYNYYNFLRFGITECSMQNICNDLRIPRDIRCCECAPWKNQFNFNRDKNCFFKTLWIQFDFEKFSFN